MTKKNVATAISGDELDRILGADVVRTGYGAESSHIENNGLADKYNDNEPAMPIATSEEIEFDVLTGQTVHFATGRAAEVTIPNAPTIPATSGAPITPAVPDTTRRPTSRQRKASLDEYRETFLQAPRIADRKPVFVSGAVRDRLDEIVRKLGDRRMSVSGLLENLAMHHLETYGPDIEVWKRL